MEVKMKKEISSHERSWCSPDRNPEGPRRRGHQYAITLFEEFDVA